MHRHFLQSSVWQEFQELLGSKTLRVPDADGTLVIIEPVHGSKGLLARAYAPYGPAVNSGGTLKGVVEGLEYAARLEGVDVLRIEPSPIDGVADELTKLGYIKRSKSAQPDVTRILPIGEMTPDQILSGMNATNRNLWRKNLSLGEQGAQFTTDVSPKTIETFQKMMHTTSQRTGAVFHTAQYFEKMIHFFEGKKCGGLMTASMHGTPLASALYAIDSETGTLFYMHAGSFQEAREYNAGNVLVANLIFYAKSLGLKSVDLFGVAPEGSADTHPLQGISKFKRAYGGQDYVYAGTWEKSLTFKHKIIQALKRKKG